MATAIKANAQPTVRPEQSEFHLPLIILDVNIAQDTGVVNYLNMRKDVSRH